MELLGDFRKSVIQLLSGRFIWVLLKSLALTVLLLLVSAFGFSYLLQLILPDSFSLPWIGEIRFLDEIVSFAAIPAILLLSPFLMFPVAGVFLGFFLDEIAGAVERRHYPTLPPALKTPMGELLIDGLQFAAIFLVVNAFALLVYFVAAPIAPLVFWAVNGYLLGREYFTQVALRRLPVSEAHSLRRKYRARVWLGGVLMAIPLSIPVFNLIIPLLGVATFTHQFQRLR